MQPAGARVARFLCPLAGVSISLLPAFLAARLAVAGINAIQSASRPAPRHPPEQLPPAAASLAAATGALAKAALRELLSDEIDHARLGWAHLSSLDVDTRRAIAPWLPSLLRANLRMWRDAPRDYSEDARIIGHGAISRELLEHALSVALHTLILPGLAQLGFDTAAMGTGFVDRGSNR